MITIEKHLDLPDTYPLERIGRLEELLFFDIETTGFSGDYSQLYLIGCTCWEKDGWHLIQWFADTAGSEEALLHAFFHFLSRFRILIHFNGDGFDLPYLMKRCRHYRLPYSFDQVQSVDIYKKIRPYRRLFRLESMKQKSVEQFLGVSRQDKYSGGELIEIYKEYLVTKKPELYDLLLLHNEDDLKGMPLILPILNYPDFFEHPFSLTCQEIAEESDPSGSIRRVLKLCCDSDCTLPVPAGTSVPPVSCAVRGNRLTLLIDLYEGSLKHFYPNYRDYYYLIYEDTAVHKSIGEFVDKSARARATAKTCYTRQEGCFLPQFSPIWEPVMKKDLKDKISYARLEDVRFQDPGCLQSYLDQVFLWLGIRH